jgi:DNA repair exonuclease SbcCD ATPase subunit
MAELERLSEQKQTEYNTLLKQKEQEFRTDLEQKDRLIGELEQKKAELERLLEQKQTEYNTLKQKEEERSKNSDAATPDQPPKSVPHRRHQPTPPHRASNQTQVVPGDFRMMERLTRQLQISPQPSSSHKQQMPRHQTPPGTGTFNPFKNQGRGQGSS